MFDDLHIPIPADLTFVTSSIDFSSWWGMWQTHVFRKAFGPRLQQINPEYVAPEEEVLNLCIFFLNPLSFALLILFTLSAATRWSRTCNQQWGAIPLPSHCLWCALLQGISTNEESDNDCPAKPAPVGLQTKTNFCNCCPPSSNQEEKDDHKKNY